MQFCFSAARSGTKPLKRVMPPKAPTNPKPAGTMSGRYRPTLRRAAAARCPSSCAASVNQTAPASGSASVKSCVTRYGGGGAVDAADWVWIPKACTHPDAAWHPAGRWGSVTPTCVAVDPPER